MPEHTHADPHGARYIRPLPSQFIFSRTSPLSNCAPSHKHDNQPNSDQDVYASNRHAETKIGLMLSDWNWVCLPRTAFSPRDCSTPNDSRRNPAIVPTAILKNDLRSRRAANRRLVLIGGDHREQD